MKRVRFAPSPTGSLHVGNALTRGREPAARRLDAPADRRHRPGAQRARRRGGDPRATSSWLGIAWDEGPVRQSERQERYREAAAPLGDRFDGITLLREDGTRDVPPRERRRRRRLRDHARRPRQRPPAERGAAPAAARGARRDAARVRPPRADPRRGRQEALEAGRGRDGRRRCARPGSRPRRCAPTSRSSACRRTTSTTTCRASGGSRSRRSGRCRTTELAARAGAPARRSRPRSAARAT